MSAKATTTLRFDPSQLRQKKSDGRIRSDRRFETFEPVRAGIYEDLYLTEHPYGFVSGVATDLPDND
jgi:hypothetical protein